MHSVPIFPDDQYHAWIHLVGAEVAIEIVGNPAFRFWSELHLCALCLREVVSFGSWPGVDGVSRIQ